LSLTGRALVSCVLSREVLVVALDHRAAQTLASFAARHHTVVLTPVSGWCGYHRDELYFAMLPKAWLLITPGTRRVIEPPGLGCVEAAWAYAGTIAALDFGHVLLASSVDLVFWRWTCLRCLARTPGPRDLDRFATLVNMPPFADTPASAPRPSPERQGATVAA